MTKCSICGFDNQRETPKKIICNLCGKTTWKHERPMTKRKPDSYLSDREKFLKKNKEKYGG